MFALLLKPSSSKDHRHQHKLVVTNKEEELYEEYDKAARAVNPKHKEGEESNAVELIEISEIIIKG